MRPFKSRDGVYSIIAFRSPLATASLRCGALFLYFLCLFVCVRNWWWCWCHFNYIAYILSEIALPLTSNMLFGPPFVHKPQLPSSPLGERRRCRHRSTLSPTPVRHRVLHCAPHWPPVTVACACIILTVAMTSVAVEARRLRRRQRRRPQALARSCGAR